MNQRYFGGKTRENKLSSFRSCIILRSGEGLTSFNKNNSANFSGEKKAEGSSRGVYFLKIREKTKLNLVLVVVLVLEWIALSAF